MEKTKKTYEEILNTRLECPLTLIRIAKGYTSDEMAEIFQISKSHMSMYEQGKRSIIEKKVINGLMRLNIDYEEFKDYCKYLSKVAKTNVSIKRKYACALGRAIGLVNPELKNESKRVFKVPKKERKLKKD